MKIGNYQIGEKIGQGTFAKVYKGINTSTGQQVAIKVLDKQDIQNEHDEQRIINECEIVKKIKHPNVIQIYDIFDGDNEIYIIMELITGGELFDFIDSQKRLSDSMARKLFQQLIDALQCIQSIGIVHRDLKPENILMRSQEQIVLIDFGLSVQIQEGQLLHTPCGSPCYAAPEMLEGKPYNGFKTDIWSCGVILYAMLCGYLPFDEENTSELYQQIKNCDYVLPRGLNDQAKDFISKILHYNVDNRMDILQIKSHDWWKLCSSLDSIILDDDEFDCFDEDCVMPEQQYSVREFSQIDSEQAQQPQEIIQSLNSYHSRNQSSTSYKSNKKKKLMHRQLCKQQLGLNSPTLELAYQIIFDSHRSKQSAGQNEYQNPSKIPIQVISKPAMKINANKPQILKRNKYIKYQ